MGRTAGTSKSQIAMDDSAKKADSKHDTGEKRDKNRRDDDEDDESLSSEYSRHTRSNNEFNLEQHDGGKTHAPRRNKRKPEGRRRKPVRAGRVTKRRAPQRGPKRSQAAQGAGGRRRHGGGRGGRHGGGGSMDSIYTMNSSGTRRSMDDLCDNCRRGGDDGRRYTRPSMDSLSTTRSADSDNLCDDCRYGRSRK